jgi:hypothetical protein
MHTVTVQTIKFPERPGTARTGQLVPSWGYSRDFSFLGRRSLEWMQIIGVGLPAIGEYEEMAPKEVKEK